MATKSRRGGAFGGGSLLGVPQALPDDDNEQSQPEERPVLPEPVEEPATTAAPVVAQPEAEPASSSARKGPPTTYRLNDPASVAVWEAFNVAKTADPFLSLRQFTSDVVREGLASRERRTKRR